MSFQHETRCQHATRLGVLCTLCGATVGEDHQALAPVHGMPALRVDAQEAFLAHYWELDNLRIAEQLVVVFDLDHTLVHAESVPPYWFGSTEDHFIVDVGKRLYVPLADALDEVGSVTTCDESPLLLLCVRPYAKRMFTLIRDKYECHIYTHGNRPYAELVAQLLETHYKAYFGGRILSRDEADGHADKTDRLRHLFPAGTDMLVIVDDTPSVWAGAEDNLITVPSFIMSRYDTVLSNVGRHLLNIHRAFYPLPSTKRIVPNNRGSLDR